METSKQKYTYVTATRTLLADLYTPVAVYMRLRDLYPKSALMESSDYHGHDNSRSFFGIHPLASVAVSHGQAVFTMPGGQVETRPVTDAYPVEQAMADFIAAFHVEARAASIAASMATPRSTPCATLSTSMLQSTASPTTTPPTCTTSSTKISSFLTTTTTR